MAEDTTDKQHQATAKRLADLRDKGQSLRSRDLSSGLIFMSSIILLAFMAGHIRERMTENFTVSFKSMGMLAHAQEFPSSFFGKIAMDNFTMLLPLFLIAIAVAVLSPVLFGGWNFTLKPLHFKLDTLNPVNNLRNMLSVRMLTNILKSMLKVAVITSVFVCYCYVKKSDFRDLVNLPMDRAAKDVWLIAKEYVFLLSFSVVLIIVYDVITNYFEYLKKSRMSTQEVKDEYKDAEGSVDVKRRQKSAQIALLKQRLSVTVPRATVVITNPTHYAVALRYEEGKDKAPKVLAKGKDYLAQQIRQIGIANSVPLYQAPALARAIYHTTRINSEINPGLYVAVAIVLSYVQQLKRFQHGLGQEPLLVNDLKIPEEFIFDE